MDLQLMPFLMPCYQYEPPSYFAASKALSLYLLIQWTTVFTSIKKLVDGLYLYRWKRWINADLNAVHTLKCSPSLSSFSLVTEIRKPENQSMLASRDSNKTVGRGGDWPGVPSARLASLRSILIRFSRVRTSSDFLPPLRRYLVWL